MLGDTGWVHLRYFDDPQVDVLVWAGRRKRAITGTLRDMFPRTAQQQWWFVEPEARNRSQAIGLRLAIAYLERDLEGVQTLLPEDDDEIRLVMGALENGLLALNQFDPPGSPEEVWARVTPIIDAAAPKVLALQMRAMLAAISHALYTFTLGDIYERQEQDPYTGAHLFAAITAMRADEHEGGIERMREKVDELESD